MNRLDKIKQIRSLAAGEPKPEPKFVMFYIYHLNERNEIIITNFDNRWIRDETGKIVDFKGGKIKPKINAVTNIVKLSRSTAEFHCIQEGKGDFIPTDEQLEKAGIDFFIETL